MQDVTLWWIIAGLLVATELITGTFYLLMLAAGAVAGALAAHLGLDLNAQIIFAGVVGGAAAMAWHLWRQRRAQARNSPDDNPEALLDIGQTVHVPAWHDDGSTRVLYRGAEWSARLASALPVTPQSSPTAVPAPGLYRIAGLNGNQLLLEKA